jgi:hypothetical protein
VKLVKLHTTDLNHYSNNNKKINTKNGMRISVTAKKKSPTTANHLRRRKALGSERKRQLLQKVLLLKG